MIQNKRILITGGAGSIGSELARQLAPHNKIFILDSNETNTFLLREELKNQGHWAHSRTGDVRDESVIKDVFEDFKPEIVFHAAALKHVTPNEEYPIEAIRTNILGTYNMLYESKRWECLKKFVFISTDKVVNARNKMGITKLCAESLTISEGKRFVAVRFGNVLASRGSVLEIWKQQHERSEPLTITDPEMKRYFMSIPEACELVIKAAEEGEGGEVFILDMGEQKKVIDLKNELYGNDYPIKTVGIRPGETMEERLMTEEESKRAIKNNGFFIIK